LGRIIFRMGSVQSANKSRNPSTASETPGSEGSAVGGPSEIPSEGAAGVQAPMITPEKKAEGGDSSEAPVPSTPPKTPTVTPAGDQEPLPNVSEQEIAEVAAMTKSLLDTRGGQALEIVLSPAIKKPKGRSPPTSPSANITQQTIVQKLKEADDRRQSLETEKVKNLSEQLAKITVAQQKKEEVEKTKVEKTQEALDTKLSTADENKAKILSEVKDKVSEHMTKIEKAQKALEQELEAARVAAEASLNEKMGKNSELKSIAMEEALKKIKEHQSHVEAVRNSQEEKLKPYVEELQSNIRAKEERAREIREKKDAELKDKLAEQNKRAEIVRQNKEKLAAEAQEGGDQTNESA